MPGMNEYLAQAYGTATPAAPTSDDTEKVAQAEMFAKLAADNGVDLSAMDDKTINELWNTYVTKMAASTKEEKKDEKDEEEEEKEAAAKLAAAEAEFTAQKEWQTKTAEADFLGRQMAHAYVDELKKIAVVVTAAEAAPPAVKTASKIAAMPPALLAAMEKHKGGKDEHKDEKKDEHEEHKDEKKDEKKEASAIDEQAAVTAIAKVAAAGLDVNEAGQKLAALLVLGVPETTKLASAPNFSAALDIRALELLEAVGYPVTWEQPAK